MELHASAVISIAGKSGPQDRSPSSFRLPHIPRHCATQISTKKMRALQANRRNLNGYVSITGHRAGEAAITFEHGADIEALMPKLRHPDYYTEPKIQELAARERNERGYCRRVQNFVVGRKGYGSVMFFEETDVRRLDLERIVRFDFCEVIVYEDENSKPPVGQGLNKPAEVTLVNVKCCDRTTGELVSEGPKVLKFVEKLKRITEEQGAEFIAYDSVTHEWKFRVKHFSRFGLDDSDDDEGPAIDPGKVPLKAGTNAMEVVGEQEIEDDMFGEDTSALQLVNAEVQAFEVGLGNIEVEGSPAEEIHASSSQTALPHSLPIHLRLDPLKMQQMRMLLFPTGEEVEDIALPRLTDWGRPRKLLASPAAYNIVQKSPTSDTQRLGPTETSVRKGTLSKHLKISPQATWQRSPPNNFGRQASLELSEDFSRFKPSKLLLSLESKSEHFVSKRSRIGFIQELSAESCVSGRTGNVTDAALFLGSSFRVGWGPHGTLLHCGKPVGQQGIFTGLSSLIHIEKVSLDATVRDEQGKVRDELVDLQFISPLSLHMSMSKFVNGRAQQHGGLITPRYLVCDKLELSNVCNEYEDLIVKQHAVEGLSGAHRLVLRHQVMVWHLLNVLFSEKVAAERVLPYRDRDLERVDGMKPHLADIDPESNVLSRRADFSSWLQDSVGHLIQDELMSLKTEDHLKEIFSLLTGRQLNDAVQIAAFKGDVRLACLLSQAGGLMINRQDVASQLDTWSREGLDHSLIEEERLKIFRLLAGDVQGALGDREIDWKRFLGLFMWYHVPPDTNLSTIIDAYSQLVIGQIAPQPIPMYVEEGASYGISGVNANGLYDTAYYLMLLHASQEKTAVDVSKMFSSFSSTYDALDHRMAWLQKGLLQAIGVLGPLQLHVLDMNFVSQLLSVGLCHWAVYVILHMPPILDYPALHEKVVKEILNQYCEVWSSSELQRSFLEKDLGIPSEWLHEALGIYWQYSGDSHQALEHYLKSLQWHRAHSLFMTSVAAFLFTKSQHAEILKFATELEMRKAELDNWDLSGGIYIDFYRLKISFENNEMVQNLDSFEQKVATCRNFFERLKQSQGLWASHSSESRFVYPKMADELVTLLLAEGKGKMLTPLPELKLYDTVLDAPVPEDVRACRLQGAVMSFTSWLSETASS